MIGTAELCEITGLKNYQIWHLVRVGRLNPERVGKLFVWDDKQIQIAKRVVESKEALAIDADLIDLLEDGEADEEDEF